MGIDLRGQRFQSCLDSELGAMEERDERHCDDQPDERDWSDLIISPRIVADVRCVLDQITTRCEGR